MSPTLYEKYDMNGRRCLPFMSYFRMTPKLALEAEAGRQWLLLAGAPGGFKYFGA